MRIRRATRRDGAEDDQSQRRIDTTLGNVTIEPGASVTFAASGTDPDASLPLSYAWSFGGGAPGVAIEDPGSITFATPGTYAVTLTVSDARGGVDPSLATRTVTVLQPNQMPNGAIDTPLGNVTIEPGASVTFAASRTDLRNGENCRLRLRVEHSGCGCKGRVRSRIRVLSPSPTRARTP